MNKHEHEALTLEEMIATIAQEFPLETLDFLESLLKKDEENKKDA